MTPATAFLAGWALHLGSAWLPIAGAVWLCWRRAAAGDWWGFAGAYAGLLVAGFGLPVVIR